MQSNRSDMLKLFLLLLGLNTFVIGVPSARSPSSSSFVRIVGGQNASITDYPYQVGIWADGQFICGGSILTTTFLLTAAHCFVEESRASRITVRVGSSYRTSGGTVFKVKKINIHSDFNQDTYDNDIAIIELASSLTLGTGVQPIQLATSTTTFSDGQSSTCTGWGYTSNDGNLADVLQVVTLPLITTGTCQTKYYGSAVSARMFCAWQQGKDSCQGDSGGPLVSNGVQIGIVSWGDVCAGATPGVYSKISEFTSYISSIVNAKRKKKY